MALEAEGNLNRCNTDEDDIDAVDLQNRYSQMKDETDSAEASEKAILAKGGKKREKLGQKRKWRESQLIDNMVNVICNDAELVHKLYNFSEKNSQVQLRPLITNTKAGLE